MYDTVRANRFDVQNVLHREGSTEMKKLLFWVVVIGVILLVRCGGEETKTPVVEDEAPAYSEEVVVDEPEVEVVEPEVELPDPVDIYADFEVTRNYDNSFFIETNLPDGTELSLSLSGRGYLGQDEVFVNDGCAVSACFSNQGRPLRGDYTLTVMMPIATVQSDYVKHFIGYDGEYLQGPYVKGALGSVIVEKEFKFAIYDDKDAESDELIDGIDT